MIGVGTKPHRTKTEGAGLYCFNCRAITVQNSNFKNLNSLKGGALFIEETQTNKLPQYRYGKYRVLSSTFTECEAVAGGAIYLRNPQYMTIGGRTVFSQNRARNSSDENFKKIRGTGGALYFDCDENQMDCLVDIADTTFSNNVGEIKGGAVHWDTIEPVFGGITGNGNTSSIVYKNNKAGRYGDNISCFPQKIAIIDEKDYKASLFSSTAKSSFFYQNEGSNRLL